VVIRGELEHSGEGVVVLDRAWIERVAKTLGQTYFSETDHVFGIGFGTAYFYSKGVIVLSIATIPGNTLRAYSQKGGGDFPIDEKQWKKLADLLREKQPPGKPPQPPRQP
jgi:hypothetical protein